MILKNITQKRIGSSHKILWCIGAEEINTSSKVNAIYKISHLETGDFYIGSTDRILSRYLQHKTKLINKRHDNWKLQRLVTKFGIDCLAFEILEILPIELERQDLYYKEQILLNTLSPSLNIATKVESVTNINKKFVYQFDLKGNLLQVFPSVISAARDHNISDSSIRDAIRGKSSSCLGFIWSYSNTTPAAIEINSSKDFWRYGLYRIKKLDLEGNMLAEWSSRTKLLEENSEYKWTGLQAALSGLRKTYKGFIFTLEKYE